MLKNRTSFSAHSICICKGHTYKLYTIIFDKFKTFESSYLKCCKCLLISPILLSISWMTFFSFIVRQLLITELSTEFSVFPTTTKSTQRLWLVRKSWSLINQWNPILPLHFPIRRLSLQTVRYQNISYTIPNLMYVPY